MVVAFVSTAGAGAAAVVQHDILVCMCVCEASTGVVVNERPSRTVQRPFPYHKYLPVVVALLASGPPVSVVAVQMGQSKERD